MPKTKTLMEIEKIIRNHLCFLTCSLKLLVSSLKSIAKWSNLLERCLTSELKVASIKPIVNTVPRLKNSRDVIISSTDQEPPVIMRKIWYTKNNPNIIKRTVSTFKVNAIYLLFILTTKSSLNKPYNKNYHYQTNNRKQHIEEFFIHRIHLITTLSLCSLKAFIDTFDSVSHSIPSHSNFMTFSSQSLVFNFSMMTNRDFRVYKCIA